MFSYNLYNMKKSRARQRETLRKRGGEVSKNLDSNLRKAFSERRE